MEEDKAGGDVPSPPDPPSSVGTGLKQSPGGLGAWAESVGACADPPKARPTQPSLTRLRISGFKSFAEPTALEILPGLTGIVGPNGCGKSNVVEALRWAMGESSARSLRGGEMDDVIFAGTTARSSRNLAEVTITLQPGETPLPDPFGAEPELQVTRRIERGAGSAYRANGRELRARDVQTLFADLSSGARSCAMVSQGRVSALVQASPEDRRSVLEEAAGITGLYARRHEAELKLRAAETNLGRAEELRIQLDAGREGLRRQARQAARYRNISGLVRTAEAEFLAVLHARAQQASEAATSAQADAQQAAESAARAANAACAEMRHAETALPALREAESEARRALQRRQMAAESLAGEAERAQAALAEAQARLAVIRGDLGDAAAVQEDAQAALARLSTGAAALNARLAALPDEIALAQEGAARSVQDLADAEATADAASSQAAAAAAAAAQAWLATAEAARRQDEAAQLLAVADVAREVARAAMVGPDLLEAAEHRASEARQTCEAARARAVLADQEGARASALAAQAAARLAAERTRADAAQSRLDEAQDRAARLDAALQAVAGELAAAAAEAVAPERLEVARAAESQAHAMLAGAERAANAAERIHGEAGPACLAALSDRDRLEARRAQLQAAMADVQARQHRLYEEARALQAECAVQEAARPAPAQRHAAETALLQGQAAAERAGDAARHCAARCEAAAQALADARAEALAAVAERTRLAAEEAGTAQAAAGEHGKDGSSLLGSLDVPAGLEAAVAAVLTDAADTMEDGRATRFWRALAGLPREAPPPGCAALDALVSAPPALGRTLSRIALLHDGTDGDSLQAQLAPGWAVVSAEGDLWRWDGLVCRAGAPNAAALRLRLLARLREIRAALAPAMAREQAAASAQDLAETEAADAREADMRAQAMRLAAEHALAGLIRARDACTAQAEAVDARIAALEPALHRVQAQAHEAAAASGEAAEALGALAEPETAEAALALRREGAAAAATALEAAREARETARCALAEAVAALRALEDQGARAQSRAGALMPQQARLAGEREEMAAILAACRAACEALADLDAVQAHARQADLDAEAAGRAAESARRLAAEAEQTQADTARAFTALDRQVAEARLATASAERAWDAAAAAHGRETDGLAAARAAQAACADPAAMAAASVAARQGVADCRRHAAALGEQQAGLAASLAEAQASLPAVEQERAAWSERLAEAARRRAALAERETEAAAACATWAAAPGALAARAAALSAAVAEAEATHGGAATALRTAEARAAEAARAQRLAEAAHAACQQAQARGEGRAEAARAAVRATLERAVERLGAEASLPEVGLAGEGAAEEERARRRHERLVRERDEMGPVNLRADIELAEIEARIAGIDADRDELATAIAKLRGSIGHLNREGRERLREVFARVDSQFRALFTRMMGGGRAHLALVGSDDPLEAGLEIYAEPPGKKLSALSLLSGGEQALTALSLIFAVFACTPAPLAVLDEVDAPLDDMNVERFCGLLDDVVRDTGTRFLVVTHHQLTMSRMDRLYGVTMQERGVSRVLSVDLQRAAAMVAEPVMQAAE